MTKTLYCFISHGEKILEDKISIPIMMKSIELNNYFIFYGGKNYSIDHDKIIHLDCDDLYCGLPEKINRMFKYVVFNYDNNFYIKLDRTVKIHKPLKTEHMLDYGGYVHTFQANKEKSGKYHFKKCNVESVWYNKPFVGSQIKYCSGIVYMLSRDNAKIISEDNTVYKNHVYEDYYVGSILNTRDIYPKTLPIKEYYFDNEHKWMFK